MATKICADFDPYALLHVPYNATEQCIQSAYRQQARVWHPDKNPSNIEQANVMFVKVRKAFDTLMDKNARMTLDRRRRQREAALKNRQHERMNPCGMPTTLTAFHVQMNFFTRSWSVRPPTCKPSSTAKFVSRQWCRTSAASTANRSFRQQSTNHTTAASRSPQTLQHSTRDVKKESAKRPCRRKEHDPSESEVDFDSDSGSSETNDDQQSTPRQRQPLPRRAKKNVKYSGQC